MVGTVGSVVIGYAMDAKAPFDPMRDMVPVAGIAEYATAMVVNKQAAGEFGEGVHRLRQGAAGQAHLRLDRRRRARLPRSPNCSCGETGINMVHVPYKGGPAALQRSHRRPDRRHHRGVSGGDGADPVRPDQGLRGRAAPIACRSIPNVPTFAEAGVPGVRLTGWLGVYGPPRLPDDIRQKLGAAIVEVVEKPEIEGKIPRHRLRADRARA